MRNAMIDVNPKFNIVHSVTLTSNQDYYTINSGKIPVYDFVMVVPKISEDGWINELSKIIASTPFEERS